MRYNTATVPYHKHAVLPGIADLHKIIPIIKAETLIPFGRYCYEQRPESSTSFPVLCCPFWSTQAESPSPNGWCDYLKIGDSVSGGATQLADQVKVCHVKREED